MENDVFLRKYSVNWNGGRWDTWEKPGIWWNVLRDKNGMHSRTIHLKLVSFRHSSQINHHDANFKKRITRKDSPMDVMWHESQCPCLLHGHYVRQGGKAAHSGISSLPLQSPSELTLLTYISFGMVDYFVENSYRWLLEFRSLAAMVILGHVPFNSLVPLRTVSAFLSFLPLWPLKM